MGNVIAEAAERIFSDLSDPQTINAARNDDWRTALWRALEDNGLTRCWVPENLGGAGVEMADGFAIARTAGRFALAVPLVETMLAAWLLARAGLPSPEGAMTVAPMHHRDRIVYGADRRLDGSARDIAFAAETDHIVVVAEGESGPVAALVRTADCERRDGESLAGDPRSNILMRRIEPVASAPMPAGLDRLGVDLMGCVLRSLQIAGALQSALDRSVTYAGERIAFGKPIGKFQAVQNNLARLAGEVAAASVAAGSAADALSKGTDLDDGLFLEATAAKIRCAEAAATGVAIAHQIHGAIGLTREHVLHRFTLRALGWRDDFDSESYWARVLGERIAKRGGDALWPLLASR
jgi:acyl-CoA dehydrogenase